MLTPYFMLTQTDDRLLICIHAPYSNIADAEIYVDKDDVRFYSSPYYLRLHLPGHVVDCDEPLVKYDADNGQFNIELIKSVPGEHFEDLDLIAKFLSPQKNKRINVKPDIQILSSSTNDNDDNSDTEDSGDDDTDEVDSSDEWLINQEVPHHDSDSALDNSNKTKYGFANQLYDVFRIVKDEFREIFDLINVEETCNSDRQKLRLETEEDQFDDDHYLCDLMEPSIQLQEVLNYKVDYCSEVHLSDDELDKLKSLGNKEYLLTKDERRVAYLSLIDILYGYAYDQRTTLGETTVESAWTINKLSATLSWLQSFNSAKEVVACCIRRSLCYPLFRHWQLSLKVLDDTINILKTGNRRVLRCLLQVHELFNNSEPRYILNQLYITDCCIWLQTSKMNDKLSKLSAIVSEVKESLNKSDISLDVDVLEIAAYSTLEDDLTDNFTKVNLENESSGERSSTASSSSSSSDVDSVAGTSSSDDSESDLDSDDDLPTDKKCSVVEN